MANDQAGAELLELNRRPVVATESSNRPIIIFGVLMAAFAAILLFTLEQRRSETTPSRLYAVGDTGEQFITSPPPISIPDAPQDYLGPPPFFRDRPLSPRQVVNDGQTRSGVMPTRSRRISDGDLPASMEQAERQSRDYQPVVHVESAPSKMVNSKGLDLLLGDANAARGASAERMTATRFKNPSSTIPKGTVVQGVLETALDSTRAGFARAITSRDTYGFDGTQILIPRGSRLIGEYKADLSAGQKRALIQWQRLMRPDGVMINLDSPAADPLGRAGVEGKVNSHFFERFSGAILQSALNIGVQLATQRAGGNSVIVALPGGLQGVAVVQPEKVQPTLKVRHGTSISVFVSRDLDFSTVDAQ